MAGAGDGDESFELRDTLRDGAKRAHLGVGVGVAGKYEIVRHLGRGGMGVVFAARHLQLGHLVAIKVLHGDVLDPTDIARFMREARAAAKLESEHVVRIHDLGLLPSGHPYLVMEHLEGEDLGRVVVTRGPMPIADATTIALQLCEVLGEAHAAGVVHRDIKPQNLFLVTPKTASDPLRIKVLDFGLAKDASSQSGKGGDTTRTRLTERHSLLGSPRFMSPEQIESAREVDGRTDIWATGATLYNLLTGTMPFPGRSIPEVLGQIMFAVPRPPRDLRPEISPELEAIVMRCLEKSPAARFATIDDLAAALRAPTRFARPSAPANAVPAVDPQPRASTPRAAPPPSRGLPLVGISMVLFLMAMGLHLTSNETSEPVEQPPRSAAAETVPPVAPLAPPVTTTPSYAAVEAPLDAAAAPRPLPSVKKSARKLPPAIVAPSEAAPGAKLPAPAPQGKTCPEGEKKVMGECLRL